MDEEGYVCQIEKNGDACRAKLESKRFNLKRHIERHHPDIFKSVVKEEQAKKQEVVQKGSTSKQQKLSKYFQSEKITVSMTKKIQTPSYSTGCGKWIASKALLFTCFYRFARRNGLKTWCFIINP